MAVVGDIEIRFSVQKENLDKGLAESQQSVNRATSSFQSYADRVTQGALSVAKNLDDLSKGIKNLEGISSSLKTASAFSADFIPPGIIANGENLSAILSEVSTRVEGAANLFNGFKSIATAAVNGIASRFPVMGAAITAALGPIGVIAAALGALYITVKANFNAISEFGRQGVNAFIGIYNESRPVRIIAEALYNAFANLATQGKLIYEVFKSAFSGIGSAVKAIFSGDINSLGAIWDKAAGQMKTAFSNSIAETATRIQGSINRIEGNIKLKEFSQEDWEKTGFISSARNFFDVSKPEVALALKALEGEAAKAVSEVQDEINKLPRPTIEVATIKNSDSNRSSSIAIKLGQDIAAVEAKYSLFVDKSNEVREKTRLVEAALKQLGEEGFTKQNFVVDGLIKKYEDLKTKSGETTDKLKDSNSKLKKEEGDPKIPGNGLKSNPGDKPKSSNPFASENVANTAASIASSINIPNINETKKAVAELTAELEKQKAVIASSEASAQQKEAARQKIKSIQDEIKAEKERGNVALSVAKQVYNAIRSEIQALLAKSIAAAIANSVKFLPGPLGVAIGAISGGAVAGLFSKLVPKLAVGDDFITSDGLAILHKGEKVVPAGITGGGFTEGKNNVSNVNVFGRISGNDITIASRYSEDYLTYAMP